MVKNTVMVEACHALPQQSLKYPWIWDCWVDDVKKWFNGVTYLTK